MTPQEMKYLIRMANGEACYDIIEVFCHDCLFYDVSLSHMDCSFFAHKKARDMLSNYTEELIFEILL